MAAYPAPSVAQLIRRDLARMTPNERRAAHRLLSDYPVAGLDTVARFGKAAGVSGPTVLRMIAKVGFEGYRSFQDALRTELAERLETPLMKSLDILDDDPLGGFADAVIDNIRQTVASVPRTEFDEVVKLLADRSRPAHLLGGRFTDSIADYLFVHLRVLRPRVHRIVGEGMNRLDQLLDIGRRDVVVVFDIRRYSGDVAAFASRAAKRGATVALLTDQWLSPVSRVAKHVLPARVVAPSVSDSAAGLLLLVEALLAMVARILGTEVSDRLALIEAWRDDRPG